MSAKTSAGNPLVLTRGGNGAPLHTLQGVPVLDDAFLEVQLVDGSWLRGKYGWDGIAPLPQLVVYLAGGRCAGLEVPNDALFRWVATA